MDASTWGSLLVARHLFEKLGLWDILDAGRRWPRLSPEEDPHDDWPSRVLQRNHGHRYYDWELTDGRLRIFEHPVNLPREKKYEGKYLIQTDPQNLTGLDAVAHYKELNEVERGFHALKDPIRMRPIWHHTERRGRAHIFVNLSDHRPPAPPLGNEATT